MIETSNRLINLKVVSLITLCLFLIGVTATGVSCYVKLDNRCEQQDKEITSTMVEQDELVRALKVNEMNYIEISTKLANIETMLEGLRADFK